jgi:hypothetical protein
MINKDQAGHRRIHDFDAALASRPVDADPVKSAGVVCDDCRVISVLVRR